MQDYLHGLGLTGAVVAVPSPPSGVSEDPVRVTVSYTYHSPVLSHLTPRWAGTLNLSAETVMLAE